MISKAKKSDGNLIALVQIKDNEAWTKAREVEMEKRKQM